MFLKQGEELLENEVDESVEMNVEESLEDSLARAVDACVRILGVRRPSVEEMGEALAKARAYTPKITKKAEKEKGKDAGGEKPVRPPRYYALMPEVDLERTLKTRMEKEDISAGGKAFYKHLVDNKRIAGQPHVTVVHEKGLPDDQELWDRCRNLAGLPNPPLFVFKLGHAVWNDRVMALTVSDVAVSNEEEDPEAKGVEFVTKLPGALKERLHVTAGTRDSGVNPFEARQLVLDWKNGKTGMEACQLEDVWVKGRVKGRFS